MTAAGTREAWSGRAGRMPSISSGLPTFYSVNWGVSFRPNRRWKEWVFLYFDFEKAFKVSKQGNWAHFKSWQENFGVLFWLLATANPFWQCGCLRRQKAGGSKLETAILTFIPFWITLHWFKILKHNLGASKPKNILKHLELQYCNSFFVFLLTRYSS